MGHNVECLLSVFYEFEIQNYMNEKEMVIKCLEQFDTKQEKVAETLFNVYPDEMNAIVRLVKKCNKHIVTDCACSVDETTGWTTVKCCNICGKPIKSENWH